METLDEDCLLIIFSRLSFNDKLNIPLVCRTWYHLYQSYNIFASETALGTTPFSAGTNFAPKESRLSLIAAHFQPLRESLREKVFRGKFVIKPHILEQIVSKCSNLSSLVLKYSKLDDPEILGIVGTHCSSLRRLDISHCLIKADALRDLNGLTAVIGYNLLSLNVLGSDKITESQMRAVLYGCPHLEQLITGIGSDSLGSIGDQESRGQYLSMVGEKIRSVHLYFKYDDIKYADEHDYGMAALRALASGHGRQLEELKLNGMLLFDWIKVVANKFTQLQTFSLGGSFSDLRVEGDYHEVGPVIRDIVSLRHLTLRLPENTCFDVGLLDIIRKVGPQLKSLSVYGTAVSDSLIIQLPHYCPQLMSLTLYYINSSIGGKAMPRPTDTCLRFVSHLKQLIHLALTSSQITDSHLRDAINSCPALRIIDVRNCRRITDETLEVCINKAKQCSKRLVKLYSKGTAISGQKLLSLSPTSNFELNEEIMSYFDQESLAFNCEGLSIPFVD